MAYKFLEMVSSNELCGSVPGLYVIRANNTKRGRKEGELHAWGRKRPRHAAADDGMTRNLVQRAGDVASAPQLEVHPERKDAAVACKIDYGRRR